MKELYIIRHGETEYNRLKLVQGSGIDSDLNETGMAQARRFFHKFASEGFNKVYTSKLKRTHQSVQRFVDLGLPLQQLEGLNEMSWGTKEGRPTTDEDETHYGYVTTQWMNGNTALAFPEGESPDEVAARMRPAIEHILAQPGEEKVLICMHGRALRVLLCLLLHYPLTCMEGFEHRNLCLYKLRQAGTRFYIETGNYIA